MTEELLDECIKLRDDRDALRTALLWLDDSPNTSVTITNCSFKQISLEKETIREKIKTAIREELKEVEECLTQKLNS